MGYKNRMKKEKKVVDKAKQVEAAKKMLPLYEKKLEALKKRVNDLKLTGICIHHDPNRAKGEMEDVFSNTDIQIEHLLEEIAKIKLKVIDDGLVLAEEASRIAGVPFDKKDPPPPPSGSTSGSSMVA